MIDTERKLISFLKRYNKKKSLYTEWSKFVFQK